MKTTKNIYLLRIIVLVIAVLFIRNVNAQFDKENLSFGAGIGITRHAQSIGGSLSYNIRSNYTFDEKNSLVISFNSQLPVTEDIPVTASALSSTTNPSYANGILKQSISFYNLSAEYNLYFLNDIEAAFAFYGVGGVGYTIASRTLEYSGFDKSLYSAGSLVNNGQESFQGFMINVGLGTNFNLSDKVALFGEIKGAIPAGNSYNSRGNSNITNPIPFNFTIGAGARFNLFR